MAILRLAMLSGSVLVACGAASGGAGSLPTLTAPNGIALSVSNVRVEQTPQPPSPPQLSHLVILTVLLQGGPADALVYTEDFRLKDEFGPVSLGGGGAGQPSFREYLAVPLRSADCIASSSSPTPLASAGGGAVQPTPLLALRGGEQRAVRLCFGIAGPATQQLVLQWSTGQFASGAWMGVVTLSSGS